MSDKQDKSVQGIQQWLIMNIADRLDVTPDKVKIDEPITDLGLSSREAIMLSGELEEWLGFELPPELMYEYPEIKTLSEMLAKGPAAFEEGNRDTGGHGKQLPFREAEFTSMVELLRTRASEVPDRKALIYLDNGEKEAEVLTFQELDRKARAIAAFLQARKFRGERALILLPTCLDFVTSFFGSLYAGVVAVPAFPPQKTRGVDRIESIVKDSGARIAFVNNELLEKINSNKKLQGSDLFETITWVNTDEIEDGPADRWTPPPVDRETIGFLQYTSGSTGNPKGVMVSHGNMLHNLEAIRKSFNPPDGVVAVSWLPLYHDMGLIGHVLEPLYLRATAVLMKPTAFLEKPVRWLEVISKYKAYVSTAPNFAYELCVEKVASEDIPFLDLSHWKVAMNGSEPVRGETLKQFSETFRSCGFQENAFFPTYGMAETTLMISSVDKEEAPKVLTFDQDKLEAHEAVLAAPASQNGVTKVSCGKPCFGEIKIVDPDNYTALPENRIGEVWIKGESVAKGYWQRPEETELTFRAFLSDTGEGPFLRTGDLAFFREGELYFTGRLKDLIIIRGSNHYPQDIEQTVHNCHPALAKDGGAAFSIEASGAERLVIVQEVRRTSLRGLDDEEVVEAIRKAVSEEHDLQVYAIQLLSPGRLPRTTSGKVQRRGAKVGFLEDNLYKVAEWKLEIVESEISPVVDLKALEQMPEQERQQALQEYLTTMVGSTLKISPQEVNLEKPVVYLGLDSIHAIEIKNRLERELQQEVEVAAFLQDLTLLDLAAELNRRIGQGEVLSGNGEQPAEKAALSIEDLTADQARELLVDIDSLTQEQVDQLLEKLSNVK